MDGFEPSRQDCLARLLSGELPSASRPHFHDWQERKDSNLQQMVLETTTLPVELRPYDRYAPKGGGGGWARTSDLGFASPWLCRLSYSAMQRHMSNSAPQSKLRRCISCGDSVWDAQGQLMYWCVTRAPRVIPNSHAIIVPRPANFFRIQIFYFLRVSVEKRHEKKVIHNFHYPCYCR